MKNNSFPVKIEAACDIGDGLAIGVSMDSNGIFKLNLVSGECTYISMIPNEKITGNRLYTSAASNNGKIYFTPFAANEIAVFDINQKVINKKKIKAYHGYNAKKKYSGIVEFGKYLFMTPCTYPVVIRINTETDEIDYYGDWYNGEKYLFRKAPEIVGTHFYLPSTINDLLLDFDMEKCEAKLHHLGVGSGFWSAFGVKEKLWLSPIHHGSIIIWDINNHKIDEVSGYPNDFIGNDFLFTKMYLYNDEVFFIPGKANMGIRVNVKTKEINKANIPELSDNDITEFLIEMGESIYFTSLNGNRKRFYRINKNNNVIEPFEFNMKVDDAKRYINEYIRKAADYGELLNEGLMIDLANYIGVLTT